MGREKRENATKQNEAVGVEIAIGGRMKKVKPR